MWDSIAVGTEVASAIDVLNVNVIQGGFVLQLDFGVSVFAGEARWIEVAVVCPAGGGALKTLEPRQELTATPNALYALEAGVVDWAGVSNVPDGLDDGDNVDDADADPENELQDLDLSVNSLSLSGDASPVDLTAYLDNTDDQTLAEVLTEGNDANGTTIANLPEPVEASDVSTKAYVDAHNDADADPANEIQDLDLSSNMLSLTGDASPVDLSGFLDDTTCDLSSCMYPGRASLTCEGTTIQVICHVPGAFWTGRTAAEANPWTSVTHGGGQFVAVAATGTNQVMTSPDGIKWDIAECCRSQSVVFGDLRWRTIRCCR